MVVTLGATLVRNAINKKAYQLTPSQYHRLQIRKYLKRRMGLAADSVIAASEDSGEDVMIVAFGTVRVQSKGS